MKVNIFGVVYVRKMCLSCFFSGKKLIDFLKS